MADELGHDFAKRENAGRGTANRSLCHLSDHFRRIAGSKCSADDECS